MNDYELDNLRETFSRLFVIAINNKMNLSSFTSMLLKSELISKIENDKFDIIFNKPIEVLFYDITRFDIEYDNSYGIYNDGYWVGQNYFDLHIKLKKSFSYLFLKLPIEKMINIYPIYHEMDFSSLVSYFNKASEEKTILRLLCEKYHCSLNDISKATLIPLSTLKKYNSSDQYLYSSSFQVVAKLVKYFDISYSLFIE